MAMELQGSIVEFLQDKAILVTGATGFLAKLFVEKVLRVQPNVKKLYLLLRATDAKSASQRFQNEVIGKDLFNVLKEKCGGKYNSLISEKVVPLAGDISLEDLGVTDSDLKDQMMSQVDAIINMAATTKFDERYDIALRINTVGAKHVTNFAKRCSKLKVLVHVSTAYVCGERGGLIQERPFNVGDTLNGATGLLDIDAELKMVHRSLHELTAVGSTQEEISTAMKDLGLARAKTYGWPNTYVFTKAMGEMLVGQLKGDLPTVILRPTVVSSTYKEPFPGWVEGVRTIDSLAVAYGKGRLNCFLCDLNGIIDVVPADMVVNSIIASMAAHSGHRQCGEIYQIGSSMRNPLTYSDLKDYGYWYFTEHPWIDKEGKPVIVRTVTVLESMASFHNYMALRYMLPLKGLELANTVLCQYFRATYLNLNRKINFVMRLADLYRPYVFFKGVFDDINTEKLRMAVKDRGTAEADIFYFDPKIINWDDYFLNIHIPGVVKHVFT